MRWIRTFNIITFHEQNIRKQKHLFNLNISISIHLCKADMFLFTINLLLFYKDYVFHSKEIEVIAVVNSWTSVFVSSGCLSVGLVSLFIQKQSLRLTNTVVAGFKLSTFFWCGRELRFAHVTASPHATFFCVCTWNSNACGNIFWKILISWGFSI